LTSAAARFYLRCLLCSPFVIARWNSDRDGTEISPYDDGGGGDRDDDGEAGGSDEDDGGSGEDGDGKFCSSFIKSGVPRPVTYDVVPQLTNEETKVSWDEEDPIR
jgi:hypothetical protein